ncbi:MAG: NIPSNAP family protein [Phycisphaeraceae bacterium]
MKRLCPSTVVLIVAVALISCLATLAMRPAVAAEKAKERLFEMRTYIANDGKLDALHARFRDHTNKLFVKHGIDLVGYWTPTEGDEAKNTLVYILAYPDRASRDKSWDAFKNDPDWKKAYADSHKDGVIVKKVISQFLAPTDYSPIK